MVRIPNTDLAPFALCEFCKSMQTHWDGPQGPLITSLSKFRSPPKWCEVRRRVLYKICKKCISRARAPRGRDAWEPLIDIKSDSSISCCLGWEGPGERASDLSVVWRIVRAEVGSS